MRLSRVLQRNRPLHLFVAACVGVASGNYIFKPALEQYWATHQAETGSMAPFKLLQPLTSSTSDAQSEPTGMHDLITHKQMSFLYSKTQGPKFTRTNHMAGLKSNLELWRVQGGDLLSLTSRPQAPSTASSLSAGDLVRIMALQPGRCALSEADKGDLLPPLVPQLSAPGKSSQAKQGKPGRPVKRQRKD
ncbi:hypothetical protein WJX73_002990 [Symbiochloris irregularis]|uniref:Uncharacterized protein n=1 Tax=Symbiochloris irregularis TaxID=706552 RepID=A0AAW1NPV2_9CHLO